MTWTLDRLKKANFLLPEISDVEIPNIQFVLTNADDSATVEEKVSVLLERFKDTVLPSEIVGMHERDYVLTNIVRNMYTTACALPNVHVTGASEKLETKQFKAIFNLERYASWVYEESTITSAIELLSEYLSYELKLFIGHNCLLQRKHIYISSPLVLTCNDNIVTFSFTYST